MEDVPAAVRVVLGLGNPGAVYARTRHNAGFLVVDALRREAGGQWRREELREESEIRINGREVLLARPMTFMNRSGWAAERIVAEHGIEATGLLVVSDDIALSMGRLRVRLQGSAGGHNGLLSVTERLGTIGFPRLRVGVGAPDAGRDAADFVLESLDGDSWDALELVVGRAAEAVRAACLEGLGAAMNRFNPAPPVDAEAPAPDSAGGERERKDRDDE